MNRRFSVLAITCLITLAAFCEVAVAQGVEDQIKKLEMDRAAAVIKGDMMTLEKATSDDYTLININGQMSDKSQMISGFKSGQNKLSKDELSEMKVRVYGDTAVITGKVTVEGMMGGKDVSGEAMFTRVYVKKGGRWQAVALQQTRISNP